MATVYYRITDVDEIKWKVVGMNIRYDSDYMLAIFMTDGTHSGDYGWPDDEIDYGMPDETGDYDTEWLGPCWEFNEGDSNTVYIYAMRESDEKLISQGSASISMRSPTSPTGGYFEHAYDSIRFGWSLKNGADIVAYYLSFNDVNSANTERCYPNERYIDVYDYADAGKAPIYFWYQAVNGIGETGIISMGNTHLKPYTPTNRRLYAHNNRITLELIANSALRASHYAMYIEECPLSEQPSDPPPSEPAYNVTNTKESTSATLTYEADYSTYYRVWARTVCKCSNSPCTPAYSDWVFIGRVITGSEPNLLLYEPTPYGCKWQIQNLSDYFNTSNYKKAGVTLNSFSDGASSISGILGSQNAPSSGSSYIAYGEFTTGLQPNTTYTLYGFAQSASGEYWIAGEDTITTPIGKPNTPNPPVLGTRGETSLSLSWSSTQYATSYRLYYKKSSDSVYGYVTTTALSYELTGLASGTTYNLYLVAYSSANIASDPSTGTNATTRPRTPTVTVTSKGGKQVTIRIDAVPDICSRVEVDVNLNGNLVKTETYNASSGTFPQSVKTITGLNPNTTYSLVSRTELDVSGTTLVSGNDTDSVTTLSKPASWAWPYTIQAGGDVYRTVYDVPNNRGIAYIMPANDWTRFQDKINLFRAYVMGEGNSFDFTWTPPEWPCTPDIINEAVRAINEMGYNIPYVSAGTIPASVFITMRSTLNGIT